MSERLNVDIEFGEGAFAEIKRLQTVVESLATKFDELDATVTDGFDNVKKKTKDASGSLNTLVFDVLARSKDVLGAPFKSGIEDVYGYDEALQELSAITDITGPRLDRLGEMAREMSLEFGGTAAGHLDSYTKMLSALTPEIANNEQALGSFGRTTAMLANTMHGDATGAIKALETAMNQYNVSLEDPIEASQAAAYMANTMAAAAKAGKIEVDGLADVVTRSGAEAASAGVDWAEYMAAIEVAGKSFGSTERLGTAMRGVLAVIGSGSLPKDTLKQLQTAGVDMGVVMNQSLSLQERLGELKKISGDGALLEKVFGAGETIAGRQLLQNIGMIDDYLGQIKESPDALQQMNDRIMGSFVHQKELLDNFFEDIRLGIFSTFGGAIPYIDMVGGGLGTVIEMAPGVMALGEAIKIMATSQKLSAIWTGVQTAATSVMTAAQWALNSAFLANPLTWIVAGIMAVAGAVWYAWENFESFRGMIYGIWDAAIAVFGGLGDFLGSVLGAIWELLKGVFNPSSWFSDDYSFEEQFSKIADAASKYGKQVGAAFDQGAAEGRAAFRKEKEEEAAADENVPGEYSGMPMVPGMPKPGGGASPAAPGADSLSGSGSGVGKSVTLRIENLVHTLNVTPATLKEGANEISTQIAQALLAGLRDVEMTA